MEAALLLRAAIPPRSARKGAALRERWAQQVGLTNALGARLAEETGEQAHGGGDRRGGPSRDGRARRPRSCGCATTDSSSRRRGWERSSPELQRLHDPRPPRPGRALPARAAGGAGRGRDARARLRQARPPPQDVRSELDVPVMVDGRSLGRADGAVDRAERVRRGRRQHAALGGPPALRRACARRCCASASSAPSWDGGGAQGGARRPRGRDRRDAVLARAALRGGRAPAGAGRGRAERAALRGHPPRHRRAGRAGGDPQQARAADRRRSAPPIERHPLIGEGILSPVEFLADAAAAGARRARALGRHRLPGRPGRRGDPARGAHPVRLRLPTTR